MRHVVVTAALGGALFLAGAAGANGIAGAGAWEGRGGSGPIPVADYHDGPRHGGWDHHRGRHDGGYGGGLRHHRHGAGHGFYEPPRPRCWIRPTHWGPEKVCRW